MLYFLLTTWTSKLCIVYNLLLSFKQQQRKKKHRGNALFIGSITSKKDVNISFVSLLRMFLSTNLNTKTIFLFVYIFTVRLIDKISLYSILCCFWLLAVNAFLTNINLWKIAHIAPSLRLSFLLSDAGVPE